MKKKHVIIILTIISLILLFLTILNYHNAKQTNTHQSLDIIKETTTKEIKDTDKGYLSICVTDYNDGKGPENGMTTYFYCYDINTEKATKITGIPYTSQYPLGVYSRKENTIYYTSQVKVNEKSKGDQLFSYDLNTKKTHQLSQDVFAINYIVPMNDIIAVEAVKKGVRELKMAFYDKKKNSFEYVNIENDLEADILSYNPFIDKLAVSFRYKSQDYKSTMDFNEGKTSKPIPPNHYLYIFDENYRNPKKVFSTKNMVLSQIALDNHENLFLCQSDTTRNFNPKSSNCIFYPKENKIEQLETIGKNISISDFMFYNNDKTQVFFIGANPKDEVNFPRGIYIYDFDTKQMKLIFTSKTGFINNFMLLKN
ncbi:hypothetical protein [Clostridium sp. FP1]|uniref:hypothetical protein n=1 Tax=Clostridium sp. FP1 TaxID=2724076 RepID=UPI0013E97812|nr:hypothetical protein [Clostridium sp. FP1]MBZ9637425.1 hypothetical protein [Clostridium sp. FP1]